MKPLVVGTAFICIACSGSAPDNSPPTKAVPKPTKSVAEKRVDDPQKNANKPRYPQGVVNPLAGAFKRFDGFHMAATIWPRLSRFHAQIDQDDRARGVLIGHVVTYIAGEEQGSPRGELDALILFGARQDAPKRGFRVATFRTIADPPGPLELVAASSDDGLSVAASSRLRIHRKGAQLIVEIHDEKGVSTRSFQRLDKNWALQPAGSATSPFSNEVTTPP